MKNNSIILKTVLLTLLFLLVFVVATLTLLSFFVPKNMANFYYDIGFKNLSQSCYYRDYKKTSSLNSLYNSLKINIECKNNSKVIARFEELSSDGNYMDFVNSMNSDALAGNQNVLIKSSICNLNAYLSEKYVLSLINLNKSEKAINYAVDNFMISRDLKEFNNLSAYVFSYFLDDKNIEKYEAAFNNEIEEGKTTFDAIVEYYNDLYDYFVNNVYSSDEDKPLKIYYGNRIIQVGLDLLKLKDYDETEYIVDSEQITSQILEIKNTYIYGLLGEN